MCSVSRAGLCTARGLTCARRMANKNLDAKHEKILKALLRLPENKRCAVCDTLVRLAKLSILQLQGVKLKNDAQLLTTRLCVAGASIRCCQFQYIRLHNLQWVTVSSLAGCRIYRRFLALPNFLLLFCLKHQAACDDFKCSAAGNSVIDARAYPWQRSSQRRYVLLKRVAMGCAFFFLFAVYVTRCLLCGQQTYSLHE